MPKIQWTDLPPALREHLFDRVRERKIAAEDLYALKLWRETHPDAPDGPWFKDFGSFKVCGEGESRAMRANYDVIGVNYAELRKPDPRIAGIIESALGSAQTILNVGAGTGSYEPTGRSLIAVEPSREMIRKRGPAAPQAIQAGADDLPFVDGSFDASMAILTIHHWPDKEAGLREMRRVTRGRIVLLTFDPSHRPWLTDYLPELAALDEAQMPAMSDFERWMGPVRVTPVLVPHDCSDGFLYAYWRRPAAYLDPHVRSGSSSFWAIGDAEAGLQRLRRDLETGEWERRYAELLALDEYDAGYRLVVAG